MTQPHLPEEVVFHILCRLPVKSLIRFTSVSKRWRFIILSDPKFAASQLHAARRRNTLGCRLIFSSDAPQLESLDFDTPLFNRPSSVTKLTFPSEPRRREPRIVPPGGDASILRWGRGIKLLGCCNGMVFVASDDSYFYIWNPATRFFKELPEPGFPDGQELRYYGVGYLSATDDYRVFATSYGIDVESDGFEDTYVQTLDIKMFSTKANVWKTVHYYRGDDARYPYRGTLLNEALHWVLYDGIFVFDFAGEEYRKMRLPDEQQHQHGVDFRSVGVSEGCLCVCGHVRNAVCFSVDFWVMREYGVDDSWSKLFNFSSIDGHGPYRDFLVMGGCTVAVRILWDNMWLLVKIDHKEEDETCTYLTRACPFGLSITPYEESLIRIND